MPGTYGAYQVQASTLFTTSLGTNSAPVTRKLSSAPPAHCSNHNPSFRKSSVIVYEAFNVDSLSFTLEIFQRVGSSYPRQQDCRTHASLLDHRVFCDAGSHRIVEAILVALRVTITDLRLYSTCMSCNQARLCY